MKNKISPRQELASFTANGNLRGLIEMNANGLSHEAIDLLVNISLRYCTSTNRKKRK